VLYAFSIYIVKDGVELASKSDTEGAFQIALLSNLHKIVDSTAGCYAELDLRKHHLEIYKYWDVLDFYNKPKLNISFEDAKEQLRQVLKSACEYRMIADVPEGPFSVVVMTVAQSLL